MGQNLILLDEAPVYSSSHMLGFFSVFNPDAIKSITVYKGGIPAAYGGRAASVLDITMNNGNNKKFSFSGGIGLVASRLTLEVPLIREKMSLMISGRRTYGDLFAKAIFPERLVSDDMEFYFYDLNAKLNYSINHRNRIYLSGYFGKDVFELQDNLGTTWGNTTGTFRWNHLFSEKLFSNTSLVYSKYDYGFLFGQGSIRLRSGIEDLTFKEDATWYLNPRNTMKFGVTAIYHRFQPGKLDVSGELDYVQVSRGKQALEGAAYMQNEQKIGERFSANYGFRFSYFTQLGPGWFYAFDTLNQPVDSVYFGAGESAYPSFQPEPRISINLMLNSESSLKASYNRISQYLHLLSNTTASSFTVIWVPSSNILKPLLVDHFSAGYFRNFRNNTIETSVELYYKYMRNTADYEDGADILFDDYIEAQIRTGIGRSYGLEFYVKKNSGKWTGWISYTLSRTENQIEGINHGDWYPVRYDKTHDLSMVSSIRLGKRWTLSGIWNYATGNAVTFPSGKYILDNNPVPYYTERNGYRMPAYHRLDISATLDGKKHKRFSSAWDFSVYNIYNRLNAYIITFQESETNPGNTEAVKLSLFGIVPSVTYSFRF
jgi:hypothetical protein